MAAAENVLIEAGAVPLRRQEKTCTPISPGPRRRGASGGGPVGSLDWQLSIPRSWPSCLDAKHARRTARRLDQLMPGACQRGAPKLVHHAAPWRRLDRPLLRRV